MTDDDDILRNLERQLRAATPAPDAARRTETLTAAQKIFTETQETAQPTRLREDRSPKGGLLMALLKSFPARAALVSSTAVTALGLFVFLPQMESSDLDMYDAAPAPTLAGAPAPLAKVATQRMSYDTAMAEPMPLQEANTETFAEAEPSGVKIVAEAPVSTFSTDVDTASWAVLRSSLTRGTLLPAGAIRIEEMVNYFPYAYAAPTGDIPFAVTTTLFETPWNSNTELLRIAVQGATVTERPPLNLVFLVDTSGSMAEPNKLPLLQQALGMVLPELAPEDQVAIVTYAGSAGVALEPTPAREAGKIRAALAALTSGGGTAGAAGLEEAYRLAESMNAEGEVGRVLLATDGDFNVGLSDPEGLERFIAQKRESGTYLSVLGFGRGNLDDATMQALAQAGNGRASYIDTALEARKVLVDELSGALFPIADDVKVQVEFNPAEVAEYRLIGYETRALQREDFNNDAVDAGDIGAGLQVTALYELTRPDSAARLTEELRYQSAPTGQPGETAFVRLRYKAPGAKSSTLLETPVTGPTTEADTEARFAAAIAGFGQLLRREPYLGEWSYADAIALAEGARGPDSFGYRSEAVRLMRVAEALADK